MKRRRRSRVREAPELNITAFMNLMVVLVPFLLITAVFSRLAILQLDLPQGASGEEPLKSTLQLEVVILEDSLVVQDRNRGLLSRIAKKEGQHDFAALSNYLRRIKATFPDHKAATILLQPQTRYEVLVKVMDAVRVVPAVVQGTAGGSEDAELFPDISIGDAPALTGTRSSEEKAT